MKGKLAILVVLLAFTLGCDSPSSSDTANTSLPKSSPALTPVASSNTAGKTETKTPANISANTPAIPPSAAPVTSAATTENSTPAKSADNLNNLITVYKSPSCSCCSKWVDHLKENGFTVKAVDVENVNPYKQKAGITPALYSCHTAFVNGYVVEGHVPASDIKRMLKEKPTIKGLTVPKMPVGTPGMEMGDRKDPHDVLSFDKNGKTSVYKSYR